MEPKPTKTVTTELTRTSCQSSVIGFLLQLNEVDFARTGNPVYSGDVGRARSYIGNAELSSEHNADGKAVS
jgi:hypothetical protein